MSVKIKVSYEDPEELQQVLQLLGSGVKFCKTAPNQKGQYKRAYVIMKDTKKCQRLLTLFTFVNVANMLTLLTLVVIW